jgi:hypothetical protein
LLARRKINLEKVRASLATPCPHCGYQIPPAEISTPDLRSGNVPKMRSHFHRKHNGLNLETEVHGGYTGPNKKPRDTMPGMVNGDVLLLPLRCPDLECAQRPPQSCPFSREQLLRALNSGAAIGVYGPLCNHSWILTPLEKDNMREQLEAGKL